MKFRATLPRDSRDETSIKAYVEALSAEYPNHWMDATPGRAP